MRLAKIPKKEKVMSKSVVREHSLHSDFFSFDQTKKPCLNFLPST